MTRYDAFIEENPSGILNKVNIFNDGAINFRMTSMRKKHHNIESRGGGVISWKE